LLPSFSEPALWIVILHWNSRSCRRFLSPHPFPGLGEVVVVDVDVLPVVVVVDELDVVVVVEEEVEVVVEDEDDVLVDVEVLEVVEDELDVVEEVEEVEQYWYCPGIVQYW
jgi:hypothetical protein